MDWRAVNAKRVGIISLLVEKPAPSLKEDMKSADWEGGIACGWGHRRNEEWHSLPNTWMKAE